LQEGDRNTNFFHQRAAWRARKNRIHKLKNSNGEWIMDQTGMTGLVNNYFSTLYAKDPEVRPQKVSDSF
jgi:hypothetical protein